MSENPAYIKDFIRVIAPSALEPYMASFNDEAKYP